ncbi:MAG: hypothetical protein SOX71_01400 [Candidatus Faecousia sp.]|nr:hypothetical protein [Candidatus Faecousia sp.]
MKKVISLILVVALFATLAISASAATIVVHEQNGWETQNQIEHGDGFCAFLNELPADVASAYLEWVYADDGSSRWSVDTVKVLSITEGVTQTATKCAEAATIKELKAVCEADERINNLTVFRQRNIVDAEGAVDISVKLWPCAPDKHPDQATVVLFRGEGEESWTVVGYAADKVCDATLPGNGAYVVALAW